MIHEGGHSRLKSTFLSCGSRRALAGSGQNPRHNGKKLSAFQIRISEASRENISLSSMRVLWKLGTTKHFIPGTAVANQPASPLWCTNLVHYTGEF